MIGNIEIQEHLIALARIMLYEVKNQSARAYLVVAIKEAEANNLHSSLDLIAKADRLENEHKE